MTSHSRGGIHRKEIKVKVEVEAKLILTIPEPKQDEFAGDFVLAAEQFVNNLQGFNMSKTHTAVVVRLHVSGEVPKVIE